MEGVVFYETRRCAPTGPIHHDNRKAHSGSNRHVAHPPFRIQQKWTCAAKVVSFTNSDRHDCLQQRAHIHDRTFKTNGCVSALFLGHGRPACGKRNSDSKTRSKGSAESHGSTPSGSLSELLHGPPGYRSPPSMDGYKRSSGQTALLQCGAVRPGCSGRPAGL